MSLRNIIITLLALTAATVTAGERTCFDSGWYFHKGDMPMKRAVKAGRQGGVTDTNVKYTGGEELTIAYTDKDKAAGYNPDEWRQVTLPHDWLVEEPFVNDNSLGSCAAANGYKKPGIGFYRKVFELGPEDRGKRVSLEFDGIFRNSTVWVNGHCLGSHRSGYLPSCYDITAVARYGDEGANAVLVKVDATDYEGWWYEGCGIYRHTWLHKTDPVHVERFGTFIHTPYVSDSEAGITMESTLRNDSRSDRRVTVTNRIYNPGGRMTDSLSQSVTLRASESHTVRMKSLENAPSLWSPESPSLYTLVTEISEHGNVLDRVETRFGIRSVEFTADGFKLNGHLYPIRGTANHQDHAGVGVAVPDNLQLYRLRLLKEMGCNAYRSAHNPPSPELLDMCDSIGLLVMDENRLLDSSEDGLADVSTLVLRDRNHPSVFIWCAENEESAEGTVTGTRVLRSVVDRFHQLDPSRPVTAAMNHGWNDNGYSDCLDVTGYNYGQRKQQYVRDHEQYPDRRMLVTECTSFVSTRGEYADDPERGYVSNLGKGVSWGVRPGDDWADIVSYPYLSGMFAWTGFDYRGEPTPYRWPCVVSHFGIMDLCGFPKDGYYAYTAAWKPEPIVHAFPHWNLNCDGDTVTVGTYSNCEELELRVNGHSYGRQRVLPYRQQKWKVRYDPGTLEIRGYNNGRLAAREKIETTGEPYAISLTPHQTTPLADGKDVVVVNVAVVDRKGRTVPTASNAIRFDLQGCARIIGVGNGDPSSHEPEKGNTRKAFHGLCQVILQTTGTKGNINLTASADGLKSKKIEFFSK